MKSNNKIFITIILISWLSIINISCNKNIMAPKTVTFVDLKKYSGLWYEIARYPNSFEKDCSKITVEYTPTDKGYIKVVNSCTKDGKIKNIEGKAFVKDKETNAKLKVQFFWPFKGDYWIIKLDEENYQYAVISDSGKKYLWILYRERSMPEDLLNEIKLFLETNGYDLNKLIFPAQFDFVF